MVSIFFKAKARQLVDQGITVIPVIIGDEVNKEHVEPVTDDEDRIVPVKPTDKPKDVTDTVDEQIKKAIKGKLHDISWWAPERYAVYPFPALPPPRKGKDNYFGNTCPLDGDLSGGSAICDGHKRTMQAKYVSKVWQFV